MLPFVWLCCSMIVPPAFVCSCWTFVAGCFDVDIKINLFGEVFDGLLGIG